MTKNKHHAISNLKLLSQAKRLCIQWEKDIWTKDCMN